MTKIEWLKLAIRDVKRHPDNAIKYINEVIELESISKSSAVSVEEIETLISNMAVECNTKNITPSFIWKCSLEELAQAIHNLYHPKAR